MEQCTYWYLLLLRCHFNEFPKNIRDAIEEARERTLKILLQNLQNIRGMRGNDDSLLLTGEAGPDCVEIRKSLFKKSSQKHINFHIHLIISRLLSPSANASTPLTPLYRAERGVNTQAGRPVRILLTGNADAHIR